MQVTAIKTHKITERDTDITKILDKYLVNRQSSIVNSQLKDNFVLAVTSKIVAICEGRVAEDIQDQREKLVEKEAEYYLSRHSNAYDFYMTIKHNTFVATAGIDRSNSNGKITLWPKDPQFSANLIREYVVKKLSLTHIGIIITDSRLSPLRWGVTGTAIAHSGFKVLKDYVGKPDLFGREMQFEKLNIADSLASAAVAVMGEGAEQTPLAVITDVPFVAFQDRNPTEEELKSMYIEMKDDMYAPLLTAVKWKKGRA